MPLYNQVLSNLISFTHNTILNIKDKKINGSKLINFLSNPTNIFYFSIGIEPPDSFLNKTKIILSSLQGPIQNSILQHFRQTVWSQRNTNMIQEEKSLNITKKIKRNLKIYQYNNQQTTPILNPFSSP